MAVINKCTVCGTNAGQWNSGGCKVKTAFSLKPNGTFTSMLFCQWSICEIWAIVIFINASNWAHIEMKR